MNQDFILKSVLDNITDCVYIRGDNFDLLYMNRPLETVTALNLRTTVGPVKCFQLFSYDRPCADCPLEALLNEGQYSNIMKTLVSREGEELKFMATPTLLGGGETGECAAVILRDVTKYLQIGAAYRKNIKMSMDEIQKSKRMEESLRKSEARYRATFEYTGTAMIMVEENRIISMANREIERLCGYTHEELENKRRWDEFVHPDDLERMIGYHVQRRKPGLDVPEKYEFRLIHKSGAVKNIMFTMGVIPGTSQSVGSMVDLTEHKQTERALKEYVDRNNVLIETIEDGFFEVDTRGNFLRVNEALCKNLGYNSDELLHMNYSSIVDNVNARKLFSAFNQVYKSGHNEQGFSWEYIRKDGTRGTVEVSVSLLRDGKRKMQGFCGIARDITERVKMEERLKYLSLHDALTGLHNRFYFEEEMERVSNSHMLPLTIICMDLNGLKNINDTMGHKRGDELIIATAGVLKKFFRSSDMVARVGGDEFVVILPGTGEEEAKGIVQRIKGTFSEYNGTKPSLTINIAVGCATRNSEEQTVDDTYKLADANMYKDKLKSGKENSCVNIRSLLAALER